MPKNRIQEFIFSLIMVAVMVYGMICYNIALAQGGLATSAFAAAFHEFAFMAPIALVLEMLVVSPRAHAAAVRMVGPLPKAPFAMIAAMSLVTVQYMCPLMSLVATLLIKRPAPGDLVAVWFQTTALNLPAARCWQLFFAGPAVRRLFALIFTERTAEGVAVSGASELE